MNIIAFNLCLDVVFIMFRRYCPRVFIRLSLTRALDFCGLKSTTKIGNHHAEQITRKQVNQIKSNQTDALATNSERHILSLIAVELLIALTA